MDRDFTKSERKRIRQLADIAWARELRMELQKIASAIEQMESGNLTPFDVTEIIHEFHNGAARDLFNQFSHSLPWLAVCRAHFEGVLTDDDVSDAGDVIQGGIREIVLSFPQFAKERKPAD